MLGKLKTLQPKTIIIIIMAGVIIVGVLLNGNSKLKEKKEEIELKQKAEQEEILKEGINIGFVNVVNQMIQLSENCQTIRIGTATNTIRQLIDLECANEAIKNNKQIIEPIIEEEEEEEEEDNN